MDEYEMSSQENKLKSYQRVPIAGQPAETEGWALLEAAKRMASAIVSGPQDDKTTIENMKRALRLNWRLWTIFQAELLDETSAVPDEIRINMLTLCQFVDKKTVQILAKISADAMVPLIDINRNIAAGLMNITQPEDQAPGSAENAKNKPEDQPRINIDT